MLRPELIEDREVQSVAQDELGHQAIARQLVDLIAEVPTPTNVALYGPWGAGKTGIANLIDAALNADPREYKGYRFVRFDAFKFAETPLRRNFITAVATGLGIAKSKYHADLYTGVTTTKFKMPPVQIRAAAKAIILTFVAVCTAFLGLAAIVALFQSGRWHNDFTQNSRPFLIASFPSAALLAGIFGLATKAFGVEHRAERAEGPEQFEKLFRNLVRDSDASKLVVFVDEIDRCSPLEVVSTLDVIRTFLGIEKCVFIVAADQHVLETALSQRVRQATPDDFLNPYYTSGSAYLDKVFQYQVTVPPLPNQSITRYAADLVANRTGVWETPNRETVVSVLIPSHVRSPRRVKHLLNSFVLAHRVAVGRHTDGLLDSWSEERCVELAKLVCLQVEFPLFARSMAEIPDLPRYVCAAMSSPSVWHTEFPFIRPRDRELAEEYANKSRPVDQLLSETASTGQLDDDNAEEAIEAEEAHGTQLLDYLSRTASIAGPHRDLMFMQGVGAPFGMPSEVADRITGAAQNGSLKSVRGEISDSNANAILDLLIEQIRVAVGLERRNVASVILGLLSIGTLEISRADTLITILAPTLEEFSDLMNEETIPGLWRLTGSSDVSQARRLAHAILHNPLVHQSPTLSVALLADVPRVVDISPETVDKLIATFVVSDAAPTFIPELSQLDAQGTARLLDVASNLGSALNRTWTRAANAKARLNADAKAAEAFAARSPYQQTGRPEVTAQAGDEEAVEQGKVTSDALKQWCDQLAADEDKRGIQALLKALLRSDRAEGRNLVQAYLPSSGAWRDSEGNTLLLKGLSSRLTQLVEPWLRAINPDAADADLLSTTLTKVGQSLWAEDLSTAQIAGVGSALGALLSILPPDVYAQIETSMLASIDSVVKDDEQAAERNAMLDRAILLIGSGVLTSTALCELEAGNLAATLAASDDEIEDQTAIIAYAEKSLGHLLDSWGSQQPFSIPTELYEALKACHWLSEPLRTQNLLLLQRRYGIQHDEPSLERLFDLIDQHSGQAAVLGAAWMEARTPTADELLRLIEKLRVHNGWINVAFTKALKQRRIGLAYDAQKALLGEVLSRHLSLPGPLLDAAGFDDLRDDDAVEILANLMANARNNGDRRDIFSIAARRSYTARTARSQFVFRLIIPALGSGVEATNMALGAIAVFGKPFPGDTRDELRRAIKPAIDGNERLTRKATEVLSSYGFPTKGRGPFGLGGRTLRLD